MDMPSNYKPFDILEIKFKGSRKDFFINTDNLYLEPGELVTVETGSSGFDVGHVSLTGELVRMQLKKRNVKTEEVIKKIIRKATEADVEKWKLAKEDEIKPKPRFIIQPKVVLTLESWLNAWPRNSAFVLKCAR